MNVKIISIVFDTVSFQAGDLPKLRGYFANKFPDNIEFHNHLPGGGFSYTFPVIQYRIIKGHPALIGINSGIELIKSIFFDLNELIINGHRYSLPEKEIILLEQKLGKTDEFINYRFSSPWMALKEENFRKYIKMNEPEQQQFLKILLRENLKSLCKGFGYWIEDIEKIKVEGFFREREVNFKNRKMLCFYGDFMVNFHIPQYLCLGKQSARGFGVVERV